MSEESATQRQEVGALVVTHGNLARELVTAAKKIVGEVCRLEAVCIAWEGDMTTARQAIAEAIERMRDMTGVLILTDMFGGTPTNISFTFLEPGRVEIVTGVNLPMLVKLLSLGKTEDLAAVADLIASRGQQSIQMASGILDQRTTRKGGG